MVDPLVGTVVPGCNVGPVSAALPVVLTRQTGRTSRNKIPLITTDGSLSSFPSLTWLRFLYLPTLPPSGAVFLIFGSSQTLTGNDFSLTRKENAQIPLKMLPPPPQKKEKESTEAS